MDEKARNVFHKTESDLSDYERMMLEIMAANAAAEEADVPAEQPAAVENPAEETPAEDLPAEEAPAEDLPAGETPAEDFPAEEASAEDFPAEETPVGETPEDEAPAEEISVEEAPVAEAPVKAAETDDSDIKIAGESESRKKDERIPLLTEEKNPELEPVVLTRPTIQFMNSIEREKKITRKVRRHNRRSGLVVLGLCVALILVAFLYNGFVNKSWGLLEKAEPTPAPTPEAVAAVVTPTPAPTPIPTPEPTPEHRYVIQKADINWITAQDRCLAAGGYLAVINTREEFDRITAMADAQGVEFLWIGCRRDADSNTLIWERDEKIDSAVDISNIRLSLWARGEPNYIDDTGTDENYISLWNHDGGWTYWDNREDLHLIWWGIGRIAYVCEFDE